MSRKTFEARLVASRGITPHIKELEFERIDGTPSPHKPGQWVTMVLPPKDEDGRIDRAYSFSSLADGTARFRVLVTKVDDGLGSTWLHSAPPGTVLPMRGPDGTFVRDAKQPPAALFVVSGTGFAPVRTMFEDALRQGHGEPMWLLLGVRSPEEIPFAEDLDRWRQQPNMRVEITLSKPPEGWTGRRGHVQEHLPELWHELVAKHPAALVYVCGWRRMVWSVRDQLRGALGVEASRMRVEAFD